jgi:hypothetical protein
MQSARTWIACPTRQPISDLRATGESECTIEVVDGMSLEDRSPREREG